MSTSNAAKSPAKPRAVPSTDEQAASFAKLSQKDRDNFERQIANAETRGGAPTAAIWRRLAGVALAMAGKQPKISGLNTIQFFIPDGNYRKQVFAMHLADDGTVILYVPNVLDAAVKAHLVTAVPKSPTPNNYTVGKGRETVTIEALDGNSTNPQFYFKDMTGWNRKALAIHLPPQAPEALVHTAEQIMGLAATWPVAVDAPAK